MRAAAARREIFGPVLAIVPVKDVEESIEFIRAREHPLCVYVFSTDKKFQARVFGSTQSGAAIANDVVLGPAVPNMPVGGVGNSGSKHACLYPQRGADAETLIVDGYYSGKFGFEQFTHLRVYLDNPSWYVTLALV